MTAGRKSPGGFYNRAIATMEADPTKAYNPDAATGFIRLNGLAIESRSQASAEGEEMIGSLRPVSQR
jgi:argininosuccinate synthase